MAQDEGITLIDTGYLRPRLCAAYLVHGDGGRAALVDCGTAGTAGRVLEAIDGAGVSRDAIDWLLVTHVHLDHAGGAGPLMRALPNARLVVHPRGAPHMIDPTRLMAGARQVYGEAMFERDHAGMLPVDAARVMEAADGHVVELRGRPLRCSDTPGHALHHYSVWDQASRSWIAGDAFGLSYRELDTARGPLAIPTTSPVQFDPVQMQESIRRLVAAQPAAIRIAHYGTVTACARMADDLIARIDAMVAIAHGVEDAGERHARIVDGLTMLYVEAAADHGVAEPARAVAEVLGGDIEINAQGLGVWLDRIAKARRT